jgi:hypothetical protein
MIQVPLFMLVKFGNARAPLNFSSYFRKTPNGVVTDIIARILQP